jgi:hypothetical protein
MTAEDDGQITAALKFHYNAKMVWVAPMRVSYSYDTGRGSSDVRDEPWEDSESSAGGNGYAACLGESADDRRPQGQGARRQLPEQRCSGGGEQHIVCARHYPPRHGHGPCGRNRRPSAGSPDRASIALLLSTAIRGSVETATAVRLGTAGCHARRRSALAGH